MTSLRAGAGTLQAHLILLQSHMLPSARPKKAGAASVIHEELAVKLPFASPEDHAAASHILFFFFLIQPAESTVHGKGALLQESVKLRQKFIC